MKTALLVSDLRYKYGHSGCHFHSLILRQLAILYSSCYPLSWILSIEHFFLLLGSSETATAVDLGDLLSTLLKLGECSLLDIMTALVNKFIVTCAVPVLPKSTTAVSLPRHNLGHFTKIILSFLLTILRWNQLNLLSSVFSVPSLLVSTTHFSFIAAWKCVLWMQSFHYDTLFLKV